MRAPGRTLDDDTRAFMEPRFGRDLGGVRVHTDAQAAASARAVQARAYTVGQHVVFAEGQLTPASAGGRELLAHELAHTVQQHGGSGPPPIDAPHSDHERSARGAARDIASGLHLRAPLPAAAVGLSRSPDDERAKAVAEAEAVLKKIDEDDAETAKQAAEDEAKEERRREEILHPSLSLLKHDPKFEAAKMTDEQIYADPNTDRAKAVAEAEAVVADIEKTQKETADEEEADAAAETERDRPFGTASLSLLGPSFEKNLMTDEEIYESIREFKPEEPGYWGKQEPEWLDKPMQISNETKYVRKWRQVTIEGVGDQADRHEYVEDSRWTISGPALLAFVEYMTGEKPTPFEQALARGETKANGAFTPVAIGDRLGYDVTYGVSGDMNHVVYNRDGSEYSHSHSEQGLVNMGIGPVALLLPGIGLRSMVRGGASLARGGLAAGRTALSWAERALKPIARRAAFTTKLAIGRAGAGAPLVAPTALGGVTSADITIVETKNAFAASRAATQTTASVRQAATTATAAPTTAPPLAPVAPATTTTTQNLATAGAGTPSTASIAAGAQVAQGAVEDTGGIPQEIADTGSGVVTARIGNPQAEVERAGVHMIGDYKVVGTREVKGDAVSWHVPVLVGQRKATHDVRGILNLFRYFIEDARKAGKSEVQLIGELVANQNVMKINRLAARFGGTSRVIDSTTIEIILPVPK